MEIIFQSINVTNEAFFKRLGYPTDYDPPEHVEELMDWAKDWFAENGNPWMNVFEVKVDVHKENLIFDKVIIDSPKLWKRYQKHNVKNAVIIVITAGDKVDQKVKELWEDDISDQSFFLESYAAAYVETWVANTSAIIKKWAVKKGLNALSRFSPGYPGWDLTDQHNLMQVIVNQNMNIPIHVMESSLLVPKKSQLSVMGIYQGEEVMEVDSECKGCSLLDCACMKNKKL